MGALYRGAWKNPNISPEELPNNEWKFVQEITDIYNGLDVIHNILKEEGFKSYYSRVNMMDYGWVVDYGSHTDFFLIVI